MLMYGEKKVLAFCVLAEKKIAMKARKSDSSITFYGRNCEFMLMDFKATFMFQRKD